VERRIRDILTSLPWLVCERAGEALGYVFAARHRPRESYRWTVESSIYVDGNHRRAGVARGLYESLLAVLGLQGSGTSRAGRPCRPRRGGLPEPMGFEPVGVYEAVGCTNGASVASVSPGRPP
jgi:phosphinothricin acetyltransferase